ncbi:PREDICTED: ubiquitin thioesterase OTUB1-like [Priapulus caudatus]|uniref:Ubiquitin thioesterase n=1 Tax=Priapulus caudatus TaxID=37621 RepID=A0ABM1EN04_PRICU|nr:PREDICTED: ubiquitin thioesterase OTUB1-like [Priapulus caudatus]
MEENKLVTENAPDFNELDSVNQDEAILAQEREIEKEIAHSQPLIGPKEELRSLESEYRTDDDVYQAKIQHLEKHYKCLRRTRGDGNCFFRAFGYYYMEQLLRKPDDLKKFKAMAAQSKSELVKLGFPEFTIDDFHSTFMEVLEKVESGIAVEDLLNVFNDQGFSDYIVVYLRLLTSGYLQKEATFFRSFIEGERTVKEFCHQEVEPMAKESDQIHIIALTSTTGIGVRIEYMDRSQTFGKTEVNHHDFPEECTPQVYLLYRPGHFDILYQ